MPVSWQCEYWNKNTNYHNFVNTENFSGSATNDFWHHLDYIWYSIFLLVQPLTIPFIFHIALNGFQMSRTTFFNVMNFCIKLYIARVSFTSKGDIQKLYLPLSHCLCGWWCKGKNLWPHWIPAWMIVVHLFEQPKSWSVQPFLIPRKSSVMKSLKNSTGGEECRFSRPVFSSLRPVRESWGPLKFFCRASSFLYIRK